MQVEIKHFNTLTTTELYAILKLRSAVFVVEQNCVYQDLDDLDKDAFHVYIKIEEQIVGVTRILNKGVVYDEVAIGRVATAKNHRHLKLGHQLMQTAMHFITSQMKETGVRLSAQSHLKKFYASYGFIATGKEYLEDGIPHSEMFFSTKNDTP